VEYHAGLDTLREEKRRNEKEYKKISSLQTIEYNKTQTSYKQTTTSVTQSSMTSCHVDIP